MSDEQRITDLEIKFSYQEELLTELNKIVTKQQLTIDFLTKEFKSLSDSIDADGSSSQDEKPPHY